MEVQKQPEGAIEAVAEVAEEVTEEAAPQTPAAAAPEAEAKAPTPAEMKVVILINGESILLGVGMTDCDPIFKNMKGDLAAALAQIPEFVADAKQKWAVSPRYPKAPEPPPAPKSTTVTPAAPPKPKVQPSFF